jgi:hypothetical protein
MAESTPDKQTTGVTIGYFATIAGLLVIIIVALSVLWFRERGARLEAEQRVQQMRKGLGGSNLMQLLSRQRPDALAGNPENGAARVAPAGSDDWSVRDVKLDGKEQSALVLKESAGRRLGFRPGDVVLVEKGGATTTPATGH